MTSPERENINVGSPMSELIHRIVNAPNEDAFYGNNDILDILSTEPKSPEDQAAKSLALLAATCYAQSKVAEPISLLRRKSALEDNLRALGDQNPVAQEIRTQYNTITAHRIANSARSLGEQYGKTEYWQIKEDPQK